MKLFLIDAYALIYRSYYAFIKNPRINSKGVNTSAIFGFINSLEDVLKRESSGFLPVLVPLLHSRSEICVCLPLYLADFQVRLHLLLLHFSL